MTFTSEGLWVVSGGRLYLVSDLSAAIQKARHENKPGRLAVTVSQPIIGFQYLMAVAANTLTSSLFVADGGTNQQIYEYSVNTHTKRRTLGVRGGYHDCDPTVTRTRFLFDDTAITGLNYPPSWDPYTWLAVDDNNNVWVQDLRGARIQHFDTTGNYVNQILTKRPSYYVAVSETMPTRLFVGWLEFTINYNVPNVPGDPDPAVGGNGSWVLAKDWMVCALGAHGSPPLTAGNDSYWFTSVERLSNGRVYAPMRAHPSQSGYQNIFELPENGSPARNTGVAAPGAVAYYMVRDGSFTAAVSRGASPNITVGYNRIALTGFDANDNPTYSTPAMVLSATTNSSDYRLVPTLGGHMIGGELSTGGYFPIYRTVYADILGYPHAGAIKSGFPSYAWHGLAEVCMSVPDFKGGWPCAHDGIAGIGPVHTEGRNFIFLYGGNFTPYGGQLYHYYEDGLMVGQFGNTKGFPETNNLPVHPGNFGNSGTFSTTTTNNGNDIYVYTGDEAYAPAHRWHISNLSSIHEYSGSTILHPNASVSLAKVF